MLFLFQEGKTLNGKNLQELIKNLQVFYKCPSCGSQYQHEDITFLGRVDEHCFMQLTCIECSLPILATILVSTQLEEPVSETFYANKIHKSDLSRGEKKHFSSLESITASEIADLHLYLTGNSTDLHTHF